MNFNESMRNERKIVEKNKGVPTEVPMSQLSAILEHQTWHKNMLLHSTFTIWSVMKII